jgi:hypothetical protein
LDAYGFSGEPGYYDDNLGSLDVTVKIGTALVPTGPAGALRLADGKISIPVTSVSLPDRLVISRVRFTPNPVRSRSVIRARFRVADLKGYVVRGALVHVLALPYGWTRHAAEVATGNDGYAYVNIHPTKKLPLANCKALVIFVRARKPGDSVIGGVSTRRLVQVRLRAQAGQDEPCPMRVRDEVRALSRGLKARIDRFALQREDAEDAFVDAVEGIAAHEAFERF